MAGFMLLNIGQMFVSCIDSQSQCVPCTPDFMCSSVAVIDCTVIFIFHHRDLWHSVLSEFWVNPENCVQCTVGLTFFSRPTTGLLPR